MSRSPTLGELIEASLEAHSRELRVGLPCKVTAYNIDNQTVDVEPLIKRPMKKDDGTYVDQKFDTIPSVPLATYRTKNAFVTLPIKKNDTVLVMFTDYNLDTWFTKGGLQAAIDPNAHTLSGAVAYPGIYSEPDSLPDVHADDIVIGFKNGVVMHVKDDMITLGEENPSQFVALAGKTLDELNKIKSYLQNIHAVLIGPPINEPGNGAPSALKIALGAAVAGGLPSLVEPAAEKVKAK